MVVTINRGTLLKGQGQVRFTTAAVISELTLFFIKSLIQTLLTTFVQLLESTALSDS